MHLGDPIEELHMTLRNRREEILRANEAFNEMAGRHEMPDRTRCQMNMALDDLLSNVMSHAWSDEREHEVRLHVELYAEHLVVTIVDDGHPFNPLDREKPDTTSGVRERKVGGLGIHLVRGVVDDVSYRRDADRNVLTLVKRLGGE